MLGLDGGKPALSNKKTQKQGKEQGSRTADNGDVYFIVFDKLPQLQKHKFTVPLRKGPQKRQAQPDYFT